MVYNPVKVFDIKYFKDIFKAGALPVFDTEFLNHDDILQYANQLSEEEELSFGIRLSDHDAGLIEKIKEKQMRNLDLVMAEYLCVLLLISSDHYKIHSRNFHDVEHHLLR
jgi:hypothetical protein